MVVYKNLTAKKMRSEIQELGATDFFNHDALVSNITQFKVIFLHFESS